MTEQTVTRRSCPTCGRKVLVLKGGGLRAHPPAAGVKTNCPGERQVHEYSVDPGGNEVTVKPILGEAPGLPLPIHLLAVVSVVAGVAWLLWFGSFLAVVCGHIALRDIKQGRYRGYPAAVAGLILGWTGMATLAMGLVGMFSR